MHNILLALNCLAYVIHGRRVRTSPQIRRGQSALHAISDFQKPPNLDDVLNDGQVLRHHVGFLLTDHPAAGFNAPAPFRGSLFATHGAILGTQGVQGRGAPVHIVGSNIDEAEAEADQAILFDDNDDDYDDDEFEEELDEYEPLDPAHAPLDVVICGQYSIPLRVPEQDALVEALIARATPVALADEERFHEIMESQVQSMMNDQPAYWAQIWPCGVALSEHILEKTTLVAGRTVLELGVGLGLCSISAAIAGAEAVLATDSSVDALAFAKANVALNNVSSIVSTSELNWTSPGELNATFDVVCCSDVLYNEDAPKLLAPLLEQTVAPGGKVLIADNADRPYEDQRRAELLQLLASKFEVAEKRRCTVELETSQGSNFTVEMLVLQRLT